MRIQFRSYKLGSSVKFLVSIFGILISTSSQVDQLYCYKAVTFIIFLSQLWIATNDQLSHLNFFHGNSQNVIGNVTDF